MLFGNAIDRNIVSGQTVQIDSNHQAWAQCTFSQHSLDLRLKVTNVDIASMRVDIDKHWRRTRHQHRIGRRIVGKAGNKNRVIGFDIFCHQGNDQSVCATRNRKRMFCTSPLRQLRFQLTNFRTTDKGTMIQNLLPTPFDVGAQ